jgi:hypothetical protein
MPTQTPVANVHPFHCMMPSTIPGDELDPLPVLRREMKLLLIERDKLRAEVEKRRATEDQLLEAREFLLGYVEWVEQLSVMEAEARKATEFWQGEAQRLSAMAQNRPHRSRWWSRYLPALRAALSSHWARVPHLAAGLLRRSVGRSKYGF